MTDYRDWYKEVTGKRITAEEIGEILNMSRATVTRRLTEDKLTSDEIIALCRRLGAEPVMALVDLKRLTVGEVFEFLDSDGQLLDTASPEQLFYLLAEHMLSGDEKLRLARDVFGDALEKPHSNNRSLHVVRDSYDGTVEEFDPTQAHAADSSPLEQEEREKRGEEPID